MAKKGRKPTGVKRQSICISGQPKELEQLKKMAKEKGLTVSGLILSVLGIR